eukprot:TRINITY_DN12994_c0_g9_i1.p1 TRINITY_DN12994_c0_g9~~TRINITY_DN12994_c0_g9_i1.p1  ORF type:complete len:700 (-),score=260.92 TRINITY_DN12994_c0_g9_i1:224-2323(-)
MNCEFMSTVLSLHKKYPNAITIFNDAYFLLAPKFAPEVAAPRMGYFFHSPFPSCELYRTLPEAREFAESVLCCDTVAFQVYEYARHFFTVCRRLLGLNAESKRDGLGIIYKGRDVLIRVGHVGISKEYTLSTIASKEFEQELGEFKKLAKDRTVIASVDKLSPISGVKNKLIAFQNLLDTCEEYRRKLLLIQYSTFNSKWVFNLQASSENKELAAKINKKYPDSVIYQEISVSNEKRLALFTVAEVLLVTSLRDGFCLSPFEFMLCKEAAFQNTAIAKPSFGSVILSEFAGCVTAMSSICRINPYVINEITDSLFNALNSEAVKRNELKLQHDLKYIEVHDTERWLRRLVEDIKTGRDENEIALYLGAMKNKILKAGKSFKNLTFKNLADDYTKGVNRVIFLDGEGTIFPIMPPAVARTTDSVPVQLLQLLEVICLDERNTVYILSGKPKELVERWFASVPRLGISAEYGFYRRPSHEAEWRTIEISVNKNLTHKVRDVFEWYRAKTDGAEIEVKDGSMAWIYRDCDPDLGYWQVQELEKALKPILRKYPELSITHDQGFAEVKLKILEKGECARQILEEVTKRKGKVDFILAAGDDIANEHLFRTLSDMYAKEGEKVGGPMKDKGCALYTCTVGRKPSYADYYVHDYKDVLMLVGSMASCSTKLPRHKSTCELNVEGIKVQYHNPNSPPTIVLLQLMQ